MLSAVSIGRGSDNDGSLIKELLSRPSVSDIIHCAAPGSYVLRRL